MKMDLYQHKFSEFPMETAPKYCYKVTKSRPFFKKLEGVPLAEIKFNRFCLPVAYFTSSINYLVIKYATLLLSYRSFVILLLYVISLVSSF